MGQETGFEVIVFFNGIPVKFLGVAIMDFWVFRLMNN